MLWLRLSIALSILLLIPGLVELFEAPKVAAVRALGFGALAGVLIAWRRPPRPAWSLLDLAVAVWVAVEIAATLASLSPRLSTFGEPFQREGLFTSLALAGLYAGARHSRGGVHATLDVAIGAAALASVYALLQVARLDPMEWTRIAGYRDALVRPFGPLGHPNLLGVVTAAATPLALVRAVLARGRRPLYAAAAALCALATLLTFSRGAWLALAAATAVAALALGPARLGAVPRRAWILALIVLLPLAVALSGGGRGRLLLERVAEFRIGAGGSTQSRLEIWRTAVGAWQDRPLLGQGPDTFTLVFPLHQTPSYWLHEWGGLPLHAHSVPLHTLATRGLFGLLAGAVGLAAIALAARRGWRAGGETRAGVAALAPALVAIGVAGLFGAIGIAGAVMVVMIAALLANLVGPAPPAPAPAAAGPHARSRKRAARSGWAPPAGTRRPEGAALLAAFLALSAVAAFGAVELSASHARRLAEARLEQDPLAAARAARRAAQLAPADDAVARLAAEAALSLARARGTPRDPAAVAEAEAAVRRAVALEPLRLVNHLRLGNVLAIRAAGGDSAALAATDSAFARALALGPMDALAMIEVARHQLWLGRPERAIEPARRAAERYPGEAQPHSLLGLALLQTGDLPGARAALERALGGDWRGHEGERREAETRLASLRAAGVPAPR